MADENQAGAGADGGASCRILLVDDHPLFMQSLKALLEVKGFTVIGTAADGFAALKEARRLRPDLILMDIGMPKCDGLTATRLIKAEMPEVKIVMLTVSASDEHLFEAVKSGANGYLLKSLQLDRFIEMLGCVQEGGAALMPELASHLLDEFARQARRQAGPAEEHSQEELSPRQVEILSLVAKGLTYSEIAEMLHLSRPTIRYHMAQILERLHLENRSQVIAYAARHGLTGSGGRINGEPR